MKLNPHREPLHFRIPRCRQVKSAEDLAIMGPRDLSGFGDVPFGIAQPSAAVSGHSINSAAVCGMGNGWRGVRLALMNWRQ